MMSGTITRVVGLFLCGGLSTLHDIHGVLSYVSGYFYSKLNSIFFPKQLSIGLFELIKEKWKIDSLSVGVIFINVMFCCNNNGVKA
jgi:hypothetical protein